jgi:hypothetical protein
MTAPMKKLVSSLPRDSEYKKKLKLRRKKIPYPGTITLNAEKKVRNRLKMCLTLLIVG